VHVDPSRLIAHHEQRTIDKIKRVSEKLPATLRAFAQLLREGKINVIGNANGLVFGRVQSPLAAPQRLERNFSPVLPIWYESCSRLNTPRCTICFTPLRLAASISVLLCTSMSTV